MAPFFCQWPENQRTNFCWFTERGRSEVAMWQEVKIRDSFLVPAFPEAGHIPALKFPNPFLPFTTRALTNKALFSVYTLLGDLTHNHSLAISPTAWRSQSPIHVLMTPRPPCSSPLRAQPQSHPPTRQP